MKDRKEEISKPLITKEINLNLFFFCKKKNCVIEKNKDSNRKKFPRYIVIN